MEETKINLTKIPHVPGVYIFRNTEGTILYIGKAVDLFRRVHQYFQHPDNLDTKTSLMVSQIASVTVHRTVSEFDALLLEAKLISMSQPKYNIIAKDDKSSLYVVVTLSEELPRVLYVRKRQLESQKPNKRDAVFGPFQSARILRNLMRMLRRITPFCIQKTRNGANCFYHQIGLCEPCPSYISGLGKSNERRMLTETYRRGMVRLSRILSGHSDEIEKDLEREMHTYAENNQFEQAALFRDHLQALSALKQKRFDPMVYLGGEHQVGDTVDRELFQLQQLLLTYYPALGIPHRIECIDISNLMGGYAVGSLVVVIDGIPDSGKYRRFRIRTVDGINDFKMIAEVMHRRFRHREWPFPDILTIDGGKGQVSSGVSVLKSMGLDIPVIGLAKRMEELIVPDQGEYRTIRLPLSHPALQLLIRLRNEAHRFAIRYHRHIRNAAVKRILQQPDGHATMNRI